MASDDQDSPASRRPALVDELERMGFQPVTPTGASASPDATPRPAPGQGSPKGEQQPTAVDEPAVGNPPQRRHVVAATDAVDRAGVLTPAAQDRDISADQVGQAPDEGREPTRSGAVRLNPATSGPDRKPQATAGAADRPAPSRADAGLKASDVVRERPDAPTGAWQKVVTASTFGMVRPGPSAAEVRRLDLIDRATRPVPGRWRIAVLSLKGGVGKTTTAAALGVQLATLRGDRVIAVDANPDRGTLAEKVPDVNPATVRDLLRDRDRIASYSDVRAYTSQSVSRLEVLGSDTDPAASQALTESDYRAAVEVLDHYYSVIITDCGTGLLHSAMTGVLGLADALIVVAAGSLDGARSASATLDWLEAHDFGALVGQSVAVVSSVRPSGGRVDVGALERHFAGRCRAVVRIPFDPHLEAGATIALEQLRKPTRQAYLELAAAVGDGLPS